MIQFNQLSLQTFLTEYWQKKPVVLRQALLLDKLPLTADELAGLALDENMESRLITQNPDPTIDQSSKWHLSTGPFIESTFEDLPETHWTLLVQGVDRVVPEVMLLLNQFDFIPQWRADDVMISYATEHGGVGPHFDHYDVFLYQATGTREWSLTTKNCCVENHIAGIDLRIMAEFETEETYALQPGDILYVPPYVGHHGVSTSKECMTYSFGYRGYSAAELWESFGDFLSEKNLATESYKDPNWLTLIEPAEIPDSAWREAQRKLLDLIQDDQRMAAWFGCFVTRLDASAEQHMPVAIEEQDDPGRAWLMAQLRQGTDLGRDGTCRIARLSGSNELFINGNLWPCNACTPELVQYLANHRELKSIQLSKYLDQEADQELIYTLWKQQWLWLIPVTVDNLDRYS